MHEKLRISRLQMVESEFKSLDGILLGTGILNNPNIIRIDDISNGDIVFYERINNDTSM